MEHGAKVNITDYHGNTSLHAICGDKANADSAPDCISVLVGLKFPLLHTIFNAAMVIQVSNGARLDIQNNQVSYCTSLSMTKLLVRSEEC